MPATKNNLPIRAPGEQHTIESIHARCVEVGECWEWLGATSHGRPVIRIAGRKTENVRAYIAHEIKGEPRRNGRYVTYGCDNPLCVNPAHSLNVTRSKLIEMSAKRTGWAMRPERRAKLSKSAMERLGKVTPDQINAIRLAEGSIRKIASETGSTFEVVRKIRNGTTYRTQGNPWAGLMGIAA